MADATPITPIGQLYLRFTEVQSAISALDPLLPVTGAADELASTVQDTWNGLLDEIAAIATVMCALPPETMTDLVAQAEGVRYLLADIVEGPLGQLLDHIGSMAA